MRQLVLYVLLFAVLLPSLSPWGTIAYYHANKEYIARVLCENRDKPQLHCDGTCYLAKKLKAQQGKHGKEITERVRNTPTLTLFCTVWLAVNFSPTGSMITRSTLVWTYLLRGYSAPLASVFQPPGC